MTPDCHGAVFRFFTDRAAALLAALEPELAGEEGMRSTALLRLVGDDCLELEIVAPDIASLRAALNMWLRLVRVADETAALTRSCG
ncbi:MAG: KEOPS complex subunit Pcc1 [Methanospirillum sp.]